MLGTPPAFILSQDQTLKKSFYPNQYSFKELWLSSNLLCLGFVFRKLLKLRFITNLFCKNCFGVGYTVQLSRFIELWSHLVQLFRNISCFETHVPYFVGLMLIRRRRDLNPRTAINDLLPFQGSPFSLLGTSPELKNGEGGIRTHVPVRTNGFQDRLVMTASIPLHN